MVPFVVKRKKLDISIQTQIDTLQQQKEDLEEEISNKSQQVDEIEKTIFALNQKEVSIDKQIGILTAQKKEIESNLKTNQKLAQQSVEAVYQAAYNQMAVNFDKDAESYSARLEENRLEYEQEYEDMLVTFVANFLKTQQELKVELDKTKELLAVERSKTQAAIDANRREDEKRNEDSKYRISLNAIDLQEIKHLKEVVPYLRNSRPISKIIWEAYFRAATNSMITRVVGAGPHTGIYRITNLLDGKCYVGQSVDIAERFRQHIKCGLGIDTPNNILYKAMLQDGVENFAFEVLEECERSQLNTQEIYWIDYYKSQNFGYNMNKGG